MIMKRFSYLFSRTAIPSFTFSRRCCAQTQNVSKAQWSWLFSGGVFSPCYSIIWLFTYQRLHQTTSMYLRNASQLLYKSQLQKALRLYWVYLQPSQATMGPQEGEILGGTMTICWMSHLEQQQLLLPQSNTVHQTNADPTFGLTVLKERCTAVSCC